MTEESAWILSIAVGVVLCASGLKTIAERQRVAEYLALVGRPNPKGQGESAPSTPSGYANAAQIARQMHLAGMLLIGGGLLLMSSGGARALRDYLPQNNAAVLSFQHSASQSTMVGPSFEEAITTFLWDLRGGKGHPTQNGIFTARQEVPACNPRFPACAPDNPLRPAKQWDGDLQWDEQRVEGSWVTKSCPVVVTLTAGAGWSIDGSRWCKLLPE